MSDECKRDVGEPFAEACGSAATWQPIQTAPKSGKAILLWWSCCKDPAVGRWEDDGRKEGWRCDGDQCVPKNQNFCTHWMPLPEPPNAEITDAGPVSNDETQRDTRRSRASNG